MTSPSKPRPWSGRRVTTARAYWQPLLPLPCGKCGKPVVHDPTKPHGGWTVGHIVDRALGGAVDLVTNQQPEHSHCNFSDGGKRGAAILNARRQPVIIRLESNQARGIRGI